MGSPANVHLRCRRNGRVQKYACIYNHWDGYPQALGIKLASIVLEQWGKAWDQGGVEYSTNHMLAAFMRHPEMKEGVSLLPVEDECFRTKYVTWTYLVLVDEDKWQVFLSATNGRLRVEELEPLKICFLVYLHIERNSKVFAQCRMLQLTRPAIHVIMVECILNLCFVDNWKMVLVAELDSVPFCSSFRVPHP